MFIFLIRFIDENLTKKNKKKYIWIHLFSDPVNDLIQSIGMIRLGYFEFGRQIAITVVNLLVFAIETVVGIFIQPPPQVEKIPQATPYQPQYILGTNNRRHESPGYTDYYNFNYVHNDEPHFIPYNYRVPYDYRTGNNFRPTGTDSQTKPFHYV